MRIAINWPSVARNTAVMAGIAVFLTVTGVYGAVVDMHFVFGWLFWFATLMVGVVTGSLSFAFVDRFFPSAHAIAGVLTAAIMSSLAVTVTIYVIQTARGYTIPISYAPYVFGMVMVITIAIMSIGYLLDRAFGETAQTQGDRADPTATFIDRLPIRYRGAALYAISSEDHYLRVYTDRGEELILMRLADAVRELSGANGLQTHRSWWVATEAVTDAKREGGKLILRLKGGTDAPVSRTYMPAVRKAGLTQ